MNTTATQWEVRQYLTEDNGWSHAEVDHLILEVGAEPRTRAKWEEDIDRFNRLHPTVNDAPSVFVDGKHKWGGNIYAMYTRRGGRITLGVVRRQPKTVTDEDQRYLVNDWTLEDRTNAVSYYRTRKQAMEKLLAIAIAAF